MLVGAAAAGGVIALWAVEPDELDCSVRVAGSLVGLVVVIARLPVPGPRLPVAVRPAGRERGAATLGRMLLAAGLSGVPLLGTWAGLMWMYHVGRTSCPAATNPDARPWMQIVVVGRGGGRVRGRRRCSAGVFGRRPVYAVLCVLSLAAMVALLPAEHRVRRLAFVLSAGAARARSSAAFYGWLPLYLPELFPTRVRATGQGFGFNFGRIIAAVGNLQMANLLAAFDNDYAQACAVVAGVYVVGLVLIVFAPETKGKPLPE